MCPVCLATAALIAGSVASTGGAAAVALKNAAAKKATDDHPDPARRKEGDQGHRQG